MALQHSIIDRIKGLLQPTGPGPMDALVLSGGGARAAYQAGVLQYIADTFPVSGFPILAGVSAGAINTGHLANNTGSFSDSVRHLVSCWRMLSTDAVFEPASSFSVVWNMVRRGGRLDENEAAPALQQQGLVDTSPLRRFLIEKLETTDGKLTGVAENIRRGKLRALAVTTLNYTTGQTVTWVQGCNIRHWDRPNRIGIQTELEVEHIMASTSLPFLFPAIRIGEAWYGDGGIRLASPLSPAIHLGADRIFVVSTRYDRNRREAETPAIQAYPPAAQIFSLLTNAVFLDNLDQDALMMERINHLLEAVPGRRRQGMRIIRLLLLRPTVDLGKLAGTMQSELRGILKVIARSLSSDQTKSPDWLSMLLFEQEYIEKLLEIGYEDAHRRKGDLERFLFDRAIVQD